SISVSLKNSFTLLSNFSVSTSSILSEATPIKSPILSPELFTIASVPEATGLAIPAAVLPTIFNALDNVLVVINAINITTAAQVIIPCKNPALLDTNPDINPDIPKDRINVITVQIVIPVPTCFNGLSDNGLNVVNPIAKVISDKTRNIAINDTSPANTPLQDSLGLSALLLPKYSYFTDFFIINISFYSFL